MRRLAFLRESLCLGFKEENLELKDFVSQSITEIVEGIEDAQKRLENSDTTINPALYNVFSGSQSGGTNLALGSQGKSSQSNQSISRLQFKVPISLPKALKK